MKLNHATGQAAEDKALNFLLEQGCSLIERNWHCRYGEIDLIMNLNHILLFIEVKYRKNQQFGGAAYSITPQKLQKLSNTIEYYLQQNNLNNQNNQNNQEIRLDAVLIEGNNLPVWIQNIHN